MTTADLIAVMNLGKIEQAGSPEEIYDRPRSEFVARFIGSSNILKGKALDATNLEVAGVRLACAGEPMTPGAMRSISIRQHEIALSTNPVSAPNTLPATVIRHVFLGNSRDYLLVLDDGSQLRVVTSPEESIPEGDKVRLTLPPQRCRVLVS
jgi:iron(III) transport system ATP-binding protein